ncbi:bifunctional diaminohydroxyphosphoribosylaminopyrimidine deaminase/5-amino-6-(5-phosphoribosylamino)uracil reductase RibD [Leucobacter tardus]|uniref:Riboflavin biosynthesis protein RibD n=1 Tax=Leucobacter tardus TaxID=501483 RepID=A0A939TLN2_9MICO|nr:dihydrofolate reductase family protein [Leucobacter tardus]MBO2988588.1 dihydrofolate reductase family protein [Leucobacter tardus]
MLQRSDLEDAMRRALTVARRGPAENANPQVGCVILEGEGRIVAEGWHRGLGTAHAEVDALAHLPEEWRDRSAELTAVVTLEPCNHTGHTGPCAEALAAIGIGAVAYAVADPGRESAGGAATLRNAGVQVLGGVLEREARAQISHWLNGEASGSHDAAHGTSTRTGAATGSVPTTRTGATTTGASAVSVAATAASRAGGARPRRPRVIAKWAQTLDGRAAAANGTSKWITGPEARADVHRRRAAADAILIGTGTLITDDPELTARTPDGQLIVPADRQPIPVVVGNREIPPHARVRQHPALAAHEISEPIQLPGVDIESELSALARYRIYTVFVEGGPKIINGMIAAGLVDELLVYVAPALLGGPKVSLGNLGITDISEMRRLQVLETLPLGADLLLRARWSQRVSGREEIAESFPEARARREEI